MARRTDLGNRADSVSLYGMDEIANLLTFSLSFLGDTFEKALSGDDPGVTILVAGVLLLAMFGGTARRRR